MSILQVAVIGSSALLGIVIVFQVALIFGAPWGEYAYGGRFKDSLPPAARVGSAISILVYVAIIGHYWAQISLLPKLLDQTFNNLANWAVVLVFAQALVLNLITRSKKERAVWAPVALLLLIASFIVALTPPTTAL